jgi:hypothetical protein
MILFDSIHLQMRLVVVHGAVDVAQSNSTVAVDGGGLIVVSI